MDLLVELPSSTAEIERPRPNRKTEQKRLLSLLEIVRREGELLLKTDARLFKANDACARITSEEDPIHAQGF
jgi:hypothetical protein